MKEEAVIDQLLGPPAGGRQAAVFLKPAEDHPEARLQVPDGHGLIQPVHLIGGDGAHQGLRKAGHIHQGQQRREMLLGA